MPYYTYESLVNEGLRFEFQQSIHDDPLTCHPESGEPIKKKGLVTGSVHSVSKIVRVRTATLP